MSDGPSFAENRSSAPSTLRKFSDRLFGKHESPYALEHAVTLPLEVRADELVGSRPGKAAFKTEDGKSVFLTTFRLLSPHGYRRKDSLLPYTYRTYIDINDEKGTHHPDDPTKQIVASERLTVVSDRNSTRIYASTGYFDNGEFVLTQKGIRETKEQKIERVKRMTDLLSQLRPEDKINKYTRTLEEQETDKTLAENLRNQIDTLIQLARDNQALEEFDGGLRRADFRENQEDLPNIIVKRIPGEVDNIEIINRAGIIPPTRPEGLYEVPRLIYIVPTKEQEDQRILVEAHLNLVRSDGSVVVPPPGIDTDAITSADFANTTELDNLHKRLSPLSAANTWKRNTA